MIDVLKNITITHLKSLNSGGSENLPDLSLNFENLFDDSMSEDYSSNGNISDAATVNRAWNQTNYGNNCQQANKGA